MTVCDIPVELGRNYTISFKIKSTLKGTVTNEETKEEKTVDSKTYLYSKHMIRNLKGEQVNLHQFQVLLVVVISQY